MELVVATPAPFTRDVPATGRARTAEPAVPVADEAVALTPPDAWTEALAQLALAAGRWRDLRLADAAVWPEAMAAHAVFLARQRVRQLEATFTSPDEAPGRVVCWFAG